MLFNSLDYIVFLPVVVGLYFLTPHRYRWMLLLGASYYFYACWKLEYLTLIVGSTIVDYWAARAMDGTEDQRRKKAFLAVSVVVNLGVLFAFKYFNFFNESVRAVFDTFNVFYDVPAFDVLLPVGISFYTFQTMSYSIDVYRGKKKAEEHFGIFALYVSFFPQLVAGPIERSTHLMPQFYQEHRFDWERVRSGVLLILWGFFKKVVIADRLAVYVTEVYSQPEAYAGLPLILATYMFAYQLYCDFSGYTDIAIGTARIMGYDLMDNFNRPFAAKSIREFWQRWHISLTRWIMDYLYVPLAKGKPAGWPRHVVLFTTFVLMGLWHGANWTFVIFGALHGLFLIASDATRAGRERLAGVFFTPATPAHLRAAGVARLGPRLRSVLQVGITFHLVLVSAVFFRANDVGDAFTVLGHVFGSFAGASTRVLLPTFGGYELMLAVLAIGTLEVSQWCKAHRPGLLDDRPRWIRWAAYYALVFSLLLFGEYNLTPFVYFQF